MAKTFWNEPDGAMINKEINIFIIEDNPGDVRIFEEMLKEIEETRFNIQSASSLAETKKQLPEASVDVVVCDLGLPDSKGLDTLLQVKELNGHLPIVVLTNSLNPEIGLKSVQQGAQDYLVKDNINAFHLHKSLVYAIERKQLIEQLREKEERFRRMFEDSTLGKFQSTPDGKIIDVNPAYAKMFGYDDVEQLKNEISYKTHKIWETAGERENLIKQLRETDKTFIRGEYEFVKKDGTRFYGFVHVRKVSYQNKPDFFLEGYIDDITEQKKAEQQLKFNLKFLQELIDNIPNPIFYKDINLRYTGCNRAFADSLGYSKEEIIGKTVYDVAPKGLADQYSKADKELLNNKQRQIYEGKVQYADTSIHEVIFYKNVLYDRSGRLDGIIGLMLDITDEKNAMEQLRLELDLNQSMTELSRQLIQPGMTIDQVSKMVMEYGKRITGAEHGYAATIDPDNGDLVVHTFTEMLQNKCNVEDQDIRFSKKGDSYPKLWGHSLNTREAFFTNDIKGHSQTSGTPDGHIPLKNFLSVPAIVNEELVGQVAFANSVSGFDEDILDRTKKLTNIFALAILKHKFTEELVDAKNRAEASDKLKSAFLANMSHEIRTPLNAIVGFSQMIGEEGIEEDEIVEYREAISSNADLLLKLISDIIEMAMIEAGETHFKPEKIYIGDLIQDIYSSWLSKDVYRDKKDQVDFVLNCDEKLKDHLINTDRLRFNQIIDNLLDNAFRFTESGSVELGCSLSGQDHVQFYVKDTGRGIPDEYLENIFDRFRQVDELTVRPFPGTGLGLAITKKLTNLLGGTISVYSNVGSGSMFNVVFPQGGKEYRPEPVSKDNTKDKTVDWGHLNILVVEDVDSNYELLDAILHDKKAHLFRAYTGNEAVRMFEENSQINLVLMDIKLPEKNGIEAIREIREKNKEIPIIVQSALSNDEEREMAFEAGCNSYLLKPITRKKLVSEIRKVI